MQFFLFLGRFFSDKEIMENWFFDGEIFELPLEDPRAPARPLSLARLETIVLCEWGEGEGKGEGMG